MKKQYRVTDAAIYTARPTFSATEHRVQMIAEVKPPRKETSPFATIHWLGDRYSARHMARPQDRRIGVSMSLGRWPHRGYVVPVVMACAALALAGCAGSVPTYRDTYVAPPPAPPGWIYRNGGYYALAPSYSQAAPAVPPPVSAPPQSSYSFIPAAEAAPVTPTPRAPQPPTLRPVDPPDAVPVDQSCGWWRLSNLWCGS